MRSSSKISLTGTVRDSMLGAGGRRSHFETSLEAVEGAGPELQPAGSRARTSGKLDERAEAQRRRKFVSGPFWATQINSAHRSLSEKAVYFCRCVPLFSYSLSLFFLLEGSRWRVSSAAGALP